MKPERTVLYRLRDAFGRLLYIGITARPEQRWKAHAATKSWWSEVSTKDLEWYSTREEAEAAESAAIRSERTPYNVAGSPWAPKPRILLPGELSVEAFKQTMRDHLRRAAEGQVLWIVNSKRNRDRQAAIVPYALGEAVEAVGGPDKAIAILKTHLPR